MARVPTLAGRPESLWSDRAPRVSFRKLSKNLDVDVAIAGAGIVGLTAALKLAQAGLSVAVLEARRVGRQVTGRSTAKISTQHGLIYHHLIESYGLERAQLYADANRIGAAQIRAWIREFAIDCDLEDKPAYAYATREETEREVEQECAAAERVGFKARVLDAAPLPFKTGATLRFDDQGQFDPTRYLLGLARAARAAGVQIFEDTRVASFTHRKRWQVKAGSRRILAGQFVMATHLPINQPGRFDLWTRPRCHIATAFRLERDDAIHGMFIGLDAPTHSLRMARDRKGPVLVALGPKFATGHDGDVARRFRDLARWAAEYCNAGEPVWRWVNEDYDTDDRVPFIGEPAKRTAPGYYVATGFNGWGISNGAAAGMLIADLAQGTDNPWAALYDPTRKAAKRINAGGETKSMVSSVADVAPGEGAVVLRGKNSIAVYRSPQGKLIARSAACTHLGCSVTWNNAEKSWDCPCHGSMFTAEGEVIHGPATDSLPVAKVPSVPKATKTGRKAASARPAQGRARRRASAGTPRRPATRHRRQSPGRSRRSL
jgi:glycine/D-amino acid oxidase-like deaminating enzyme/nitrite reductase/ring-hydroxylating ferredoxin subunit